MSDNAALVEELLQAKFEPADLKSYTKKWTKNGEQKSAGPFTYVEDEAVMDRLDAVLGLGGWAVEAIPFGDTVVRITLRIRHPETKEWTEYQDFGYATNADSPEPLKEAWTDAFRRTARIPGVARYVYAGEAPAPSSAAPQPTSATLTPVVQQAAPVERPPLPLNAVGAAPGSVPYQDRDAGDSCPAGHGAWSVKPGGFSKHTNKPYDAFYACSGKTPNGGYCNEKPSKAWVDAHPIAS